MTEPQRISKRERKAQRKAFLQNRPVSNNPPPDEPRPRQEQQQQQQQEQQARVNEQWEAQKARPPRPPAARN